MFKIDYDNLYKDQNIWIYLMAGGNDIIFDMTDDFVLTQKIYDKTKTFVSFLNYNNHKRYKLFLIPTFLYISPSLIYMDYDGRRHLHLKYNIKKTYDSLSNKIDTYTQNMPNTREKIIIINTQD